MIGMADGNRKRISFIRAIELGFWQEHADHRLHLPFVGVPGPNNALLD